MVSVAYGQGGRMRVCILPPTTFKNVFDVLYNFSIILNLFAGNNKPSALSTHNRKCANKMSHISQSTQN